MVKTRVTLSLSHFRVRGFSMIALWGGGTGEIDMYSYDIPCDVSEDVIDYPSGESIIDGINDGGFGCEMIMEAHCYVYAVYTSDADVDPDVESNDEYEVFIRSYFLVHEKEGWVFQ